MPPPEIAGLLAVCAAASPLPLAVVFSSENIDSTAVAGGAVVALLLLALLTLRLVQQRKIAADELRRSCSRNPAAEETACGQAVESGDGIAGRMCSAFEGWFAENRTRPDLWTAFDQLVRELLTENLGATRVRCYRVEPGMQALQAISQSRAAGRAGLLDQVARSGREYIATAADPDSSSDESAVEDEDRWGWIWPVRDGAATIGVVAVGNLAAPGQLTSEARQTIGELVSLFWRHVATAEQLDIVRRTDQASGVLTRGDFFTLAGHGLAESYREHEPSAIVALALEGLRGLDDTGCWRERDALIESVGKLIGRRLRSDDLVGRFADDRFVVLLRRLDGGLGQLIAGKILAGAHEELQRFAAISGRIRMRAGVAASGAAQPPLETLLVSAFGAVERDRRSEVARQTAAQPGAAERAAGTEAACAPAPDATALPPAAPPESAAGDEG